ncbi:cbb3-type cytochrome oxidase assembly protein CcoS [Halomonas sp. XH26]|uniref:Cbb3-type cytochrome oxidase assembly protein CcoS n=1 Tax=Vreelandella alkaliphila TaxID=272774 RepID=A0AAJ2RSY0_9GAMM|nr:MULTISPECIES: cbb3-type cytochrome oxidase assembly protein CcoS [Halomonas]MCD6004826.1 cbb3-type cytochrome oxidase assembly protein CcoS [Halomonas sp. IOP_6]MDX5977192.1 cbb3-type cytochrome oxidase assembly protein CcoS [Halomonas alkaliphila]PAU71653.1 cbb3-type cytochrome oxidase assembly protein CcoS [Halomonas humidisoli]UTA79170.1 cbb3-type cytochrome oxidase assembly protein CcoS [Halomonas sp. XH26]UTD56149.1 cbb3-type cytochrome oxidase assembly protein CcoS [Halomonas sp. MS1]
MTILYLLIPLSLTLLGLAVWAFFWAVKHDQFDDLEGPAHRILFDDDENDLTPEQRAARKKSGSSSQDNQEPPA